MENKWVIIIVAVICLVIGLIIGKNIFSSNQRSKPLNSSFSYNASYIPPYRYREDNEERITELENQREEARDKIQEMRDKLEEAKRLADDREWSSFQRWSKTGKTEDFLRNWDDEDQKHKIEEALDDLDEQESSLND